MKQDDSTCLTEAYYRPVSYWEDSDPLGAILRNIKGTNRRRMIADFWNAGKLDDLDPANLADETDPELRLFLESIDPSFMGGEYLPGLLPTEVEIARVELESTTADVISIRARHHASDKLIHYRIVDEYDSSFAINPESSQEPLTLGELISLIDTTNGGSDYNLATGYNQMNLGEFCDAESLRHFTTISSTFYPGLYDHYESIFEQWVKDHK